MTVTPVAAVVHVGSENRFKPGALSATAVATPTGLALPLASSTATVTTAEHVPAVAVRGGVVKASFVAEPATRVSVCCAEVSPVAFAVTLNVAIVVPLKKNVALLDIAAIAAVVVATVHEASKKKLRPAAGSAESAAAPAADTGDGFPNASCTCSVAAAEQAPMPTD